MAPAVPANCAGKNAERHVGARGDEGPFESGLYRGPPANPIVGASTYHEIFDPNNLDIVCMN